MTGLGPNVFFPAVYWSTWAILWTRWAICRTVEYTFYGIVWAFTLVLAALVSIPLAILATNIYWTATTKSPSLYVFIARIESPHALTF